MEKLAQAIKIAAKLHEESFDHNEAKEAESEGNTVNLTYLYKISIREASDQAKRLISPREFGYKRIIYGWLWWNFEERR